MLYLYYTVSSAPEEVQSKAMLSLGGFKSSTKVPNGILNNLFGDISPLTYSNFNQNRYIGLVLKNESTADLTNISIYFNYPEECFSKFRLAAIDMALNSNSNLQMEQVDTVNSKPLYAAFEEANGAVNAVNIGDIGAGEQVGLWIEMEMDLPLIKQSLEEVYIQNPQDEYRYLSVEKEKLDNIDMVISWD